MAAGHVYHWKHGWIPLTYFAALQKAHGSRSGAVHYLNASHDVHGSDSPGQYNGFKGVHVSSAAQATLKTLRDKNITMKDFAGNGTTIYWRHPGTGKQTAAKVVGIEKTGHIIIEHSGHRNALIGHSTYSTVPHPNTPFEAAGREFHNPHVHTKVIENGDVQAPTQTHVTAPRVTAKPPLTPKNPTYTGFNFELPHHFTELNPNEVNANHFVTTASRKFEASKIRQAYSLGPHKVFIQAALTKEQTQAFLHDVKETLHQAHPTVGANPVTFLVPTNDRHFRKQRAQVFGYVVRGASTVHVHPKVARGEFEEAANKEGFTPSAKGASVRRYVLTHELGHVVDSFKSRTHEESPFSEGVALFRKDRSNISLYGKQSIQEGYAEAFAQHQLGGIHHGLPHVVAEKYAKVYGWQKASKS